MSAADVPPELTDRKGVIKINFMKKDVFGLKRYLSSNGIQTDDVMMSAIAAWDGLYRGKSSLSLPSAISSEIARLVTMDLKSDITGSDRADYLDRQYKLLLAELRRWTEYACAKGGVVFKPYISEGSIKIGVIQAENFIPLEYDDSGRIYGGAFLDRVVLENQVYTRVERHIFESGIYKIYNRAFVSQTGTEAGREVSLKEVDAWGGIEPEVAITGLQKPLFAYFKMPMANTIDSSSPLGVSVYAKCESLMCDAEKQYARLLWEFESGERALYVDEGAVRRDGSGKHILPDKRLFRLLNSGDDTLFKDWTPDIREASLINGLNTILRRLEFASGLAYGTLSDIRDTDKTAEEIRASKQRSYSLICDIQACLKTALLDLVTAMDALCDLYELCGQGGYDTAFEFNDGVAADRRAEFEEKLRLVEMQIMQPWELRAWYFGEDEIAARKALPGEKTMRKEFNNEQINRESEKAVSNYN